MCAAMFGQLWRNTGSLSSSLNDGHVAYSLPGNIHPAWQLDNIKQRRRRKVNGSCPGLSPKL
jgi:hypothetical protein